MNYCEKHWDRVSLTGCIPGDEVMVRRDEECPECVREARDMLRDINELYRRTLEMIRNRYGMSGEIERLAYYALDWGRNRMEGK